MLQQKKDNTLVLQTKKTWRVWAVGAIFSLLGIIPVLVFEQSGRTFDLIVSLVFMGSLVWVGLLFIGEVLPINLFK
jgi:hypothetical protein